MGSAPELCKGVHQKACDLEGVKGAAPPKHPLLKTMTTTTFKPSVQFLEAGEKAQEFTNAANTFKPFLSQEARQSIEGVDKVAQAFTATGQALEHFGFDEADEDDSVGAPASDIVKGVGVGITTTGGAISTYSAASTPVTTFAGIAGTVWGGGIAAVGGLTAFTGFVLGWCGLDVDESETYEQQNGQVDVVTGYAFNNDHAARFDWSQTHHDDGIIDGNLGTAENVNGGWMTTEPLTEITVFPLGQATTFDESGMDGLVAAGPFDAVTLNEPQNNNVF